MKVSHKAIEMIKHHEGVRTRAYRCPALLWTIGVGHVIDPAHGKVKIEDRKTLPIPTGWDRVISMGEVDDILATDLGRFERGVATLLPISLSQGEFDACVSFSFNVGLGTLQRSTFRQKLLRGDKDAAIESLLQYCKAGGKVLRGLEKRRKDEATLFRQASPMA